METAAKYGIPLVAVLWNNSSWGPSFEQMPLLKGRTDAFDMSPASATTGSSRSWAATASTWSSPTKSCPPCDGRFDIGQAGRDQRGGRQTNWPPDAGR